VTANTFVDQAVAGIRTAGNRSRLRSNTLTNGTPIKVGLIQGNIAQTDKWNPARAGMILDRYLQLSRQAVEKGAQFLIWPESSTPFYFDGDSLRLSQVLANLLNNACKFTPPGGHVEVATRVDGDDVVITVTDDGIGFADADRHRIFDMFVQLDESRSQSTGGLGIGLTLVRSIVAMHGGRIDAQSEGPERGATFTLHLPCQPPQTRPQHF